MTIKISSFKSSGTDTTPLKGRGFALLRRATNLLSSKTDVVEHGAPYPRKAASPRSATLPPEPQRIAEATAPAAVSGSALYTYGVELELHHVGLVRLETVDGRRAPVHVHQDKLPLFDSDLLDAVSDSMAGERGKRLRKDLTAAGVDLGYQYRNKTKLARAYGEKFGPINTIELNTRPFALPNNNLEKRAVAQIQALDEHLRKTLAHASDSLINFKDWLTAYNQQAPVELRILPHRDLPNDVFLIAGNNAKEMLITPPSSAPSYYSQVNLSVSLESWNNSGASAKKYIEDHTVPGVGRIGRFFRTAVDAREKQIEILNKARERAGEAVHFLRQSQMLRTQNSERWAGSWRSYRAW